MRDPECRVGPGSPQVAGPSRGEATRLPAALCGTALPAQGMASQRGLAHPSPRRGWPWGLPSRVQLERGTDRVGGHLGA